MFENESHLMTQLSGIDVPISIKMSKTFIVYF